MIKLRALEKKDIPGMLEWMHSEDSKKIFQKDMSSIDENAAGKFVAFASKLNIEDGEIHFAVVDDVDDEYLGTISLKHIDKDNEKAEYAVSMRKKAQGTGAASCATKEILRLAFTEYGLNNVYLNVLTTNERANGFYKKMGFVYEGTSRDCLIIGGEYKSLNWYSMLKSEYVKEDI